jgi:hypothetical protein
MESWQKPTQMLARILDSAAIVGQEVLIVTKTDDRFGPDRPGRVIAYVVNTEQGVGVAVQNPESTKEKVICFAAGTDLNKVEIQKGSEALMRSFIEVLVNEQFYLIRSSEKQLKRVDQLNKIKTPKN